MIRKIGFVSTYDTPETREDIQPPAADLTGEGWEYWFKTRLRPIEPTPGGDGQLRLNGTAFVNVVWRASQPSNAFELDAANRDTPYVFLQFDCAIQSTQQLAAQLARCIPELASQVLAQGDNPNPGTTA